MIIIEFLTKAASRISNGTKQATTVVDKKRLPSYGGKHKKTPGKANQPIERKTSTRLPKQMSSKTKSLAQKGAILKTMEDDFNLR